MYSILLPLDANARRDGDAARVTQDVTSIAGTPAQRFWMALQTFFAKLR